MHVYERIAEAITRFEEQGHNPHEVNVSDEVWNELATEVESYNKEREQAAREAEAFHDWVSNRFPNVASPSTRKWERVELEVGGKVYGLTLGRLDTPGYAIEVN